MTSSVVDMPSAGTESDPIRVRRVQLILHQVEHLPTLPVVAARLLALTCDERSDLHAAIDLIRSDAAVTARLLGLCRRAALGVRSETLTIDQAVVFLGLTAVRNAVLTLRVHEMLAGGGATGAAGLDRKGLWRHSLAVALAAEQLVTVHPRRPGLDGGAAFVCGLLHDIGKLALDQVLPKSYARVVELAELNQGNIAEFERKVLGLDHHTAGKRLAEQWHLPQAIQDCIWLHGTPYAALPRLDHRELVGVVSLADLLVRLGHVGWSGNFPLRPEVAALSGPLGLDPEKVRAVAAGLHDWVERRCADLGVDAAPAPELYRQSIENANAMLGRLNSALERRAQAADRQRTILDAVARFQGSAEPGPSVEDVLGAVVASAASVWGAGFYAMLQQDREGEPWLVAQYNAQGRRTDSQVVEPPADAPALGALDARAPMELALMRVLPWIADALGGARDANALRLLPLGCGWGTAAVLVHDRSGTMSGPELRALTRTWGSAIAAAGAYDRSRRLGEELAEANRGLAEAQDRLLRSQSMARLGEMAAGAAHEMNNPLAVISGRAQLLATRLPQGTKDQDEAQTIAEQAQRLGDLVQSWRLLVEPPAVERVATDISRLLEQVLTVLHREFTNPRESRPINMQMQGNIGTPMIDPKLVSHALLELLRNAMQAQPKTAIHVAVRWEGESRRLVIEVRDDGLGMDPYTLEHAMDPFFSAKPAGRRLGLGLARARQNALAQGGDIELRSTPDKGTTAVLTLAVP
jgi:putative nucleotidyltransferase with HDIG domain